ncbi:MAG: hypothetical protein RR898_05735 [Clostridium sp.]
MFLILVLISSSSDMIALIVFDISIVISDVMNRVIVRVVIAGICSLR